MRARGPGRCMRGCSRKQCVAPPHPRLHQFRHRRRLPIPHRGAPFATRCAQPGLVRCVRFDDVSDFNTGSGGLNGAYQQNAGIMPPYGTSDYTRAVRDTTAKASGNGSLKFTVPANAGADTSGMYFTNFSTDLNTQFGENSEFYVQWRQRFSLEFLINNANGGGWKQIIIGTRDQPGTWYSSCTAPETVLHNDYYRGFAQMYKSCDGSASHGPSDPFEQPFGASDFKLQNARPSPYCLYSQKNSSYFPPVGDCFGYFADEWMTSRSASSSGRALATSSSTATAWCGLPARGQPSQLVINFGPYSLTAGDPSTNQRFAKPWPTPYKTGRDASATQPVAYTCYEEPIISRKPIADPWSDPFGFAKGSVRNASLPICCAFRDSS